MHVFTANLKCLSFKRYICLLIDILFFYNENCFYHTIHPQTMLIFCFIKHVRFEQIISERISCISIGLHVNAMMAKNHFRYIVCITLDLCHCFYN